MDVSALIMLGGAGAWAAAIGWALHRYRKKTAENERERALRFEQILGTTADGRAVDGAASGGAPTVVPGIDPARLAAAMLASGQAAAGRGAAAARVAAAEPPIIPAPAYQLRERVLDRPGTLVYYAIRTAVPDHEVFIGLSLAALLDVPETVRGYDRELRLRRLAPLAVDFAIVDKSMQLVAVIDLEPVAPGPEQHDAQRAKAEYLRALSVRHLTFPRTRLPKYQDIRQLLQGPR